MRGKTYGISDRLHSMGGQAPDLRPLLHPDHLGASRARSAHREGMMPPEAASDAIEADPAESSKARSARAPSHGRSRARTGDFLLVRARSNGRRRTARHPPEVGFAALRRLARAPQDPVGFGAIRWGCGYRVPDPAVRPSGSADRLRPYTR